MAKNQQPHDLSDAVGKSLRDLDGISHINVDINAKTELGKMLSHFYELPFLHPVLGQFNSMEGFWWWVKSNHRNDQFRKLSGAAARQSGRRSEYTTVHEFRKIIASATYEKITQNDELLELVCAATLPFQCYYLFGPLKVPIDSPSATFLCSIWEEVRDIIKTGGKLPDIDYTAVLNKQSL